MESSVMSKFRIKRIIFILFFLLIFGIATAQDKSIRIVFWNVENLFDTRDDSLTNDDEFLPDSERNWDNYRFYAKLNNIYKVIMGIGGWEPPAIIGLCEVENRFVLNQLIYETPLKKFEYRVVHYESPDRRGIDVGLLYRKSDFNVDTSLKIPIHFPFDPDSKTRDILCVKGRTTTGDTLHLFVNHWPSRYGGYLNTQPKRNFVAEILKTHTDSLLKINSTSSIIILGDFNDDPTDASLSVHLDVRSDTIIKTSSALYNLMTLSPVYGDEGTLKYQESWNVFDQIIVSGNLFWGNSNPRVSKGGGMVFNAEFLFEQDEKYLGRKPFRTYQGFKYNGGFSDHLPVYVDLMLSDD
jgi:hypothetical protein